MGIFPFWDKLVIHDKFVANFAFFDQREDSLTFLKAFLFPSCFWYSVIWTPKSHSSNLLLQGKRLNEIFRGRVSSVHFVCFLVVGQAGRQAGKDITSAFSPIADSHLTCGNLASSQTHRCNPDQGQCQWDLFEEEVVSRGSAVSRKIEGARVETCQTHSSTPDWVRAAQLAFHVNQWLWRQHCSSWPVS